MDIKKRSEYKQNRKDWSIKTSLKVCGYTISGLLHFFKHERSAMIYLAAAFITIASGLILQLGLIEWIVILFVLFSLLSAELINTAIEAICDLVCPEQNPLVKVAKDCGSAATGVLTVFGIGVVAVIYIPRIITLIQSIF